MSDTEVITCQPHEQCDVLVERARDHLEDRPPASLVYVVPTKRLAQHVEKKLTESGGFVPLIGTPIAVASRLYERTFRGTPVLSFTKQKIVLERVLEEEWGNLEYLSRHGDRPSQGMVNQLHGLFRSARAERIVLDAELSGSNSPKDRDIVKVYAAYLARLERAGTTDPAGAMERLIVDGGSSLECVELLALDTLPPGPTPLEEQFVRWLSDGSTRTIQRSVCCPGMTKVFEGEEPTGASHGDGTLAGGMCARLFRAPSGEDKHEDLADRIDLLEGPERPGELEVVAAKVRDLLDSGEVQPGQVSVLFPDTRLYQGIIEPVFERHGIPVDMLGRQALLGTGPGRSVANLLNAALKDFPRQAVVDLVRSPYIEFVDENTGTRLDEEYVRKVARRSAFAGGRARWARELMTVREKYEHLVAAGQLEPVELDRMKELAKKAREQEVCLNAFLDLLAALAPGNGDIPPRVFADRVRAVLDRLDLRDRALAYGDEIAARDAVALRKIDDALSTLEDSAELLEDDRAGADRLIATFNVIVSMSRFGVNPRRSDAVQVMGIREAQGIVNDHVFICDLAEKDFPKKPSEGALVPNDAHVRDRLAVPDGDIALQRYHFLMAVSSARERIYLSRPTTIGEKDVISSIFLDEVVRQFAVTKPVSSLAVRTMRDVLVAAGIALGKPGNIPRDELLKLSPVLRGRVVRAVRVERMERMMEGGSAFAGVLEDDELVRAVAARFESHAYSATEIETYSKCPFSFMARYLLGLKEAEDPDAHVTPLTLGNVVHRALHRFLTSRRDSDDIPMRAENVQKYSRLLREEVRQAVEHLGGESISWEILPDVLLGPGGTLARWIETECETDGPFPGFHPTHLELGFGDVHGRGDEASLERPVEIMIKDRPLAFTGKIDRVDADGEGGFVIYDYKSSKKESAGEIEMRRGQSIQLALYPQLLVAASRMPGASFPRSCAAASFYRVSPAASLKRKYLCAGERVEELVRTTEAYKLSDRPGNVMLYQKYRKPVVLEDVQGDVNDRIIAAVDGIASCAFEPAGDSTGSQCEYCVARHACRDPSAKVARWI